MGVIWDSAILNAMKNILNFSITIRFLYLSPRLPLTAPTKLKKVLINQPTNQPSNQPIKQAITQSTNSSAFLLLIGGGSWNKPPTLSAYDPPLSKISAASAPTQAPKSLAGAKLTYVARVPRASGCQAARANRLVQTRVDYILKACNDACIRARLIGRCPQN